MNPTERARAAMALADAATDPRDRGAFRAAARAWERLAAPSVAWSYGADRLRLAAMKETKPEPAPRPRIDPAKVLRQLEEIKAWEAVTIEF